MSINQLNSVNLIQAPTLKAKEQNKPDTTTTPIETKNVSFRGTEALAAYNHSLVNKNDIFNIPVLKPLNVETDINKIEGEKIYNSKRFRCHYSRN